MSKPAGAKSETVMAPTWYPDSTSNVGVGAYPVYMSKGSAPFAVSGDGATQISQFEAPSVLRAQLWSAWVVPMSVTKE